MTPHVLGTLTCESSETLTYHVIGDMRGQGTGTLIGKITGIMRVIQFPDDLRCHRRLPLAGSGRHRYAVPLRAGNWSRLG